MIYTVFFDSAEMPQDFQSYIEALEYGKYKVLFGYATSFKVESTEGEVE